VTTAPQTVVSPGTAQAARVIVIEEEGRSDSLRDLLNGLAGRGYRIVHEFSTLDAAGPVLEREAADLVLIDIGSFDLDGLNQIAEHPVLGVYVPFVVVDSVQRDDVAHHAMEAGAQDYVVRDRLTPEALERCMRWALARSRELRDLRRDNDLFRLLLENVPDRIYFKDRQNRFIRVSRSVADAHHLDNPDALIGKSDFSVFPADQAEEMFTDEQRVMETGVPIIGRIAKRNLPDGSEVWVSSTKLPLRDRRGRIVGTFGITRDVTNPKKLEIALAEERNRLREANEALRAALQRLQRAHDELRELQLQLIEAEKLKSIGRLAAGVAHEVKNPLAILTMGIDFFTKKYGSDRTSAGVLREMNEAVSRADMVIKGLLDFSAPRKLELQPCDLNAIVRMALRLVRGEIRKDLHRVEQELGEIPEVPADRSKVCQVFVNLFTNALHAMADGGTLTVRTWSERFPADQSSEVFQPGEEVVVVEIADTGPGIPPELLPHIFEPFVTTKPVGKGTGLGMTVVRSIMNLQRGTVTLANRREGGVIARLTFRVQISS